MTTRHNLTQKYWKRVRQIKALNETISTLGTRFTPLTSSEGRSLFIAWRNLRRAYEDIERIRQDPLWK